MAADLATIWCSAALALTLRFTSLLPQYLREGTIAGDLAFLLLYSGLIVLFSNLQGTYSRYEPSGTREMLSILKAVLMATALLTGCLYLSKVTSVSRLLVAMTMVLSLVAMSGWRHMRRRTLAKAIADGHSCHNVLVIGTDHIAKSVWRHFESHPELGLVVAGLVSCDRLSAREECAAGSIDDLGTLCRVHFVDELFVCTQDQQIIQRVVAEAQNSGVGVRLVPSLCGGISWGTEIEYLGELPTMAVHHRRVPIVELKVKRAFDTFASAVGLLTLSPILAAIAILVKLDSEGPAIYGSARIGRKGRTFRCYKFRTMVKDADRLKNKLRHLNERDGILFKISDDPRITRLGRILRKYSLDELPQLWNVLKGEMSIVGPRPPLANEVQQYEVDYLRRLDVAPGITGLWQVEARRNASFAQYIELDLKYVERWSLSLDLKILLRTFSVVIGGTGQ